jgi:hypothetical protein
MISLYGQAALAGATGGTSAVAVLVGALSVSAELLPDEEPPDPATIAMAGRFTEPTLPPNTIVDQDGVTINHNYRSNDHDPPHAHVEEDGKNKTKIGQNGKPLAGEPELTSRQQNVVQQNRSQIRSAVRKIGRWLKYKKYLGR